jgi:hypothetical protein
VISVTDKKAAEVLTALRDKHRAIMETGSELAQVYSQIVEALNWALEALGYGE